MSRKWIVVAAIVAAITVGFAPWIMSQESGVLVVDGATLIDGTGARPVPDSVIVIENGKITAVGPRARVRVPAGARRINAKGKYAIPGLIDSHVHYRSWMGELFINNGITTVFDFGNDVDYIMSVRDAERSGKEKDMPRLYVVGEGINRAGGNFSPSQGANAGTPARKMPPGTPHGPEWAKMRADAMIAKGVDALKTQTDNLDADEVKAIADEAHKANLKFIGHVTDVERYVNAGFDGVVHTWSAAASLMTPEDKQKWGEGKISYPTAFMDQSRVEPMIKLMLDHHTAFQPLIINDMGGMTPRAKYYADEVYQLFRDPELRYVTADTWLAAVNQFSRARSYSQTIGEYPRVDMMSPALLAEYKRAYANMIAFSVKWVKSGGLLWLGTDTPGSGNIPGLSIRQEIEALVDGGLTPMQGIQSATLNTSKMFNLKDVGTVQVGKWGDVLILDGNPLTNIANIDKIHTIIKAGDVLDRKYHLNYHPSFWLPNEQPRFNSHSYPKAMLSAVSSESTPQNGTTIAVKGRNFFDVSVIYVNGLPLKTTFENIGEIRGILPPDAKMSGPVNVMVQNPWPGGGDSNAMPLTTTVTSN